MLKNSQFAKDINTTDKLLKNGIKSIEKIKQFIENNNKNGAVNESIKLEVISEKIVNKARLIPIASARKADFRFASAYSRFQGHFRKIGWKRKLQYGCFRTNNFPRN